MEFTFRITSAKTVRVQVDRSYQITIGFDVLHTVDEEEVVYGSYSHGFPIMTTAEDITAGLTKFCETLALDLTQAADDAELTAQLAHAEAVQSALLNDLETPE